MLYSCKSQLNSKVGGGFGRYPLWLADYIYDTTKIPAPPTGFDKWILWQYSDKGEVKDVQYTPVD